MRIGGVEKSQFFWIGHFEFIFSKKNFFSWKKIKMADSEKLSFSKPPILNFFFSKISWIGPWVSGINWCEGHQCGSTYICCQISKICIAMECNIVCTIVHIQTFDKKLRIKNTFLYQYWKAFSCKVRYYIWLSTIYNLIFSFYIETETKNKKREITLLHLVVSHSI